MARIGFVADVHIGNHKKHGGEMVSGVNERCRLTLKALADACRLASQKGCERLYVAGDLFDNTRPSPQLIRAVQEIFQGECPPVTLLMGNHDQVSMNDGDNALGPMQPVCQVVESPCITMSDDAKLEIWLVPFQPGDARKWLPSVLSGLEGGDSGGHSSSQPPPSDEPAARVLAFHLGISDTSTPAFLQKAHDAIGVDQLKELCEKHNISYVFSGNWHDRKTWAGPNGPIFQTGALVPTGWDNPGLEPYGTLGIIDSEEGLSYEIIPGPRFVKAKQSDKVQEIVDAANEAGHKLYLQIVVDPTMVREYSQESREMVQAGSLNAVQVVPDHKVAKENAKKSAGAARSVDTLEEAINEYVKTLTIPEGLSAEDVIGKAKELLST